MERILGQTLMLKNDDDNTSPSADGEELKINLKKVL